MAAQADEVQAAQGGPFTDSQHERRHILGHAGLPADEGVVPDVDELVRGGQPSHHDLAAHGHMSRQGRGIGQHIVVADGTVMNNMNKKKLNTGITALLFAFFAAVILFLILLYLLYKLIF